MDSGLAKAPLVDDTRLLRDAAGATQDVDDSIDLDEWCADLQQLPADAGLVVRQLVEGRMQQIEKAAAVLAKQRDLMAQKEQQISELSQVVASFTNRLRSFQSARTSQKAAFHSANIGADNCAANKPAEAIAVVAPTSDAALEKHSSQLADDDETLGDSQRPINSMAYPAARPEPAVRDSPRVPGQAYDSSASSSSVAGARLRQAGMVSHQTSQDPHDSSDLEGSAAARRSPTVRDSLGIPGDPHGTSGGSVAVQVNDKCNAAQDAANCLEGEDRMAAMEAAGNSPSKRASRRSGRNRHFAQPVAVGPIPAKPGGFGGGPM